MTKVGKMYSGFWPERPVSKVKEGMKVRYPSPEGRVLRGQVQTVAGDVVYFKSGGWCYLSEINEDKD